MAEAKKKARKGADAQPAPDAPKPAPRPGVDTVDVSAETLAATRPRALLLLNAVGTHDALRLAMAQRGYTEEEHQRGWDLLHEASGYRAASPVGAPVFTGDAAKAVRELDAWDDRNFPVAEVALRHRHPAQRELVFRDLAAGRGPESVVRVATFLDRLDALEKSPDDRAALETLAKRGITEAERTRLRGLVQQARGYGAVNVTDADAATKAKAQRSEAQTVALKALRAWYEEWSTVAKNDIQRKDWLILMGLASRKKPRTREEK